MCHQYFQKLQKSGVKWRILQLYRLVLYIIPNGYAKWTPPFQMGGVLLHSLTSGNTVYCHFFSKRIRCCRKKLRWLNCQYDTIIVSYGQEFWLTQRSFHTLYSESEQISWKGPKTLRHLNIFISFGWLEETIRVFVTGAIGLTKLHPLIMTCFLKCRNRINVVFFAGQTCDT